jgi:hypothetical protein
MHLIRETELYRLIKVLALLGGGLSSVAGRNQDGKRTGGRRPRHSGGVGLCTSKS